MEDQLDERISQLGVAECQGKESFAEKLQCVDPQEALKIFEQVYGEISIPFPIVKYDYLLEKEALTDFTGWESIDDGILYHKGDDETLQRWAEDYFIPKVQLTLPKYKEPGE